MAPLLWLGALTGVWIAVAARLRFPHMLFDLPAHFALQNVAGCLGVMALSAGFDHPGPFLLAACALAASVKDLLPFFAPRRGKNPGGGTRLKVLQANILMRNRDMNPLRRLLLSENPDIAVIAEVSTPCAAMLEAVRDIWPHQIVHVHDTLGTGLALLSRLPLLEPETRHLACPDIPCIFAVLEHGGRRVDIVAAHAANPLKRGLKARDDELTALARWHAEKKPGAFVITGDLNATPWCAAYKNMLESLGIDDPRRGRGLLGTFPAFRLPLLRMPIDHVLAGGAAEVESLALGEETKSDHLPLIAEIRIAPP